jgi:restriction endonuclease S subunit
MFTQRTFSILKYLSHPSLEVQHKIVKEIEGYQKLIDGARQVVESWKPQIEINPEWPMVKLGEICDVRDGTHDSPKYVQQDGFPLITSKNIKDGKIDFSEVNLITKEDLHKINERSMVDDGDIVMPMIGTIGNPIVVRKDREFGIKNVALIKFYADTKAINYYVKEILDSNLLSTHYQNQSAGSTQKFISLGFIRSLEIPLPPLEIQRVIIDKIEAERKVVDGCWELIKNYELKIKDVIDKVWEE